MICVLNSTLPPYPQQDYHLHRSGLQLKTLRDSKLSFLCSWHIYNFVQLNLKLR
ncbi:Protein LURP-one-related 3 [Frankliniella fusca]|uniref:Protein LURP-one-related 3 n=1 Tax=Frankliniella fusca TaxID=407009 RepID=A0AAE1L8I2_9NEOP|nr:Protein LURP-one-related 3 [Frankliniella fusca]